MINEQLLENREKHRQALARRRAYQRDYGIKKLEVIILLHAIFNDYGKVYDWLNTKHPDLKNKKPFREIERGQADLVKRVAENIMYEEPKQ